MAGGLGKRLGSLTQSCPKPLLKIGGTPILEIIVNRLAEQGFRKLFISVNYRGEMIEDHFGDGARWTADIQYLREPERLGTAGALSLLPERPPQPFVVMNGDLLTKLNLKHLLDFHREHRAKATMCVREYQFQVPFGVVQADEHRLLGIDEKPTHRFLVNAGIYALDPDVLDLVPKNQMFDMPHLFEKLVATGHETMAFPIREYWMDIGRMDDLEQAASEYCEIFG
jgi:NDP-sugar pyrophosphorylase family protein